MHNKQKFKIIILVIKYSVLCLCILSTLISQNSNQEKCFNTIKLDKNWVRVCSIVDWVPNKTQQTLRSTALKKAKNKAIEFINGTRIQDVTTIYQHSKSGINISQLTREIKSGMIVDERNLDWKYIIGKNGDPKYIKLSVDLLVKVGKGISDPNFNIKATLNKDVFNEGESIVISVKSSQNCYVTIFSQSKCFLNSPVTLLFPHKFSSNNYLPAGEVLTVPDNDDWTLNMVLPEGLNECDETITVVATKDSISYWSAIEKISDKYNEPYQIYYETSYKELIKWLTQIPIENRTTVDRNYSIFKYKEN